VALGDVRGDQRVAELGTQALHQPGPQLVDGGVNW
jgi:hypothetical protein